MTSFRAPESARYRGRFAPSPTGPLHFGSMVAAVGSFLDARAHGGEWLVRIDDLDPLRAAPGAADTILRALEACGLFWDGAVVYQSRRARAYHAALHELRGRGLVFPCACSRREIADSGIAGIEGSVYPGTCRGGLPAGRVARALRVRTAGARVALDDAVQGRIEQDVGAAIGDFVLYRADGVYAYHLAAVVDDAEQGITDIVRGADLADSTPRQIFLQRQLGLPQPRYAHLPVAVNAAGEKLSKQTLAAAIDAAAPVPLLNAVLQFLGQDLVSDCAPADTGAFWQRAVAGWRLARVARERARRAPD